MRQTGRLLWENEPPPAAVINYLADQLGVDARLYALYAHRIQTRFDHSRHLIDYLGLRTASQEDRRAALVAAIEAATNGDSGFPIAAAIVGEFRRRSALLPSLHSIEKIGLGGRAIARRRAENALIAGIPPDRLASMDRLLKIDPSIGQTRFHWLRSAPEAPGASNLVGLTERISFLRKLEIDPKLQARISSGRWDQMIREGNATPAWLANDFNASRRHALIVAQVIKLGQKLTDDAVTMFVKLMGRLFSQAITARSSDTLIVTPTAGDVPAAAEELNAEISDMYPLVEVPDLLREVHEWTGFADCFTHVRTGDVPRNVSAMLAGVLADATNLGPKRMATASKGISAHQIGWMRTFHARSETYRAAQACVTDAHTRHPHARLWGNGTTASSDGQFFRASDRAAKRGDVNLHYGTEPGSKFYSHLSDQYGYFSILPISPTESEAAYVLDGLFDQDTVLDIEEHFTDTGGASDHVFGLFALIGKRFAPRLRNLKDRRFHTFEKGAAYPALSNHIGAPINTALILDHWDDLLHLAASITTRSVVPSTILKKLSASPKESQLARALRELGRIERSLFMIEWYSSPALRRRCQAGLNKGEAAHKLKRAVFFHERGEIRDRSFESQAFRASGLNLVVSAIVHWNTVYIDRAVAQLKRTGRNTPDTLLKHISPLSWEHINLTGLYTWDTEHQMPEGFRSLRLPARSLRAAA